MRHVLLVRLPVAIATLVLLLLGGSMAAACPMAQRAACDAVCTLPLAMLAPPPARPRLFPVAFKAD